jgi:hypothetical protein
MRSVSAVRYGRTGRKKKTGLFMFNVLSLFSLLIHLHLLILLFSSLFPSPILLFLLFLFLLLLFFTVVCSLLSFPFFFLFLLFPPLIYLCLLLNYPFLFFLLLLLFILLFLFLLMSWPEQSCIKFRTAVAYLRHSQWITHNHEFEIRRYNLSVCFLVTCAYSYHTGSVSGDHNCVWQNQRC